MAPGKAFMVRFSLLCGKPDTWILGTLNPTPRQSGGILPGNYRRFICNLSLLCQCVAGRELKEPSFWSACMFCALATCRYMVQALLSVQAPLDPAAPLPVRAEHTDKAPNVGVGEHRGFGQYEEAFTWFPHNFELVVSGVE